MVIYEMNTIIDMQYIVPKAMTISSHTHFRLTVTLLQALESLVKEDTYFLFPSRFLTGIYSNT